MHLPNVVLSPAVAGVTLLGGATAVAVSSRLAAKRLDESRLPMMGVLGAFVFAAQMINFPILPGVSGHLCGGALLAILLGPASAIVVMSAILTIQCLVFNDGGLLALGANIINLGVVSCLVSHGCYKLILGSGERVGRTRFRVAVFGGTFLGIVSGAALVPAEIVASHVSSVPFGVFFGAMVAVGLIIGAVEGVITLGVVGAVWRMRPELVDPRAPAAPGNLSRKAVAAIIIVAALLVGGVLSLIASSAPDGLEFVLGEGETSALGRTVVDDDRVAASARSVTAWQEGVAPLPDYGAAGEGEGQARSGWTSVAGIVGTGMTLAALYGVGLLLRRRRRRSAGAVGPG